MKNVRNFIPKDIIENIEKLYNVQIHYNYNNIKLIDQAASAGDKIFLGSYSNLKLEILCIFHELGHIIVGRKGRPIPCYLANEVLAWDECIRLIDTYKDWFSCIFDFEDYYGEEMKFIRSNLASWCKSDYNELLIQEDS